MTHVPIGMDFEDSLCLTRRLLDAAGVHPDALMVPHADVGAVIEVAVAIGCRVGAARLLKRRHCRVCGCADLTACGPEPCSWVEADLCSACAEFGADCGTGSREGAGDPLDRLRAYAGRLVDGAILRCASIVDVAADDPLALSNAATVLGQAYAESMARGLPPAAPPERIARAIGVAGAHLRETVPLFVQLLAARESPFSGPQ